MMLDREVVKQAKVLAASEGITLKELVETALMAWILRWPKVPPSARRVTAPKLP